MSCRTCHNDYLKLSTVAHPPIHSCEAFFRSTLPNVIRGFIWRLMDCLIGYCHIDSRLPPTHRVTVRRICCFNCLEKCVLTLRCGEVFTQPSVFDSHNFVWLLILLLTDPLHFLASDCLFGYRPIDSRPPLTHTHTRHGAVRQTCRDNSLD